MSQQCKDCHAPILWLTHKDSRQRMPVDPEPAGNGNILPLGGGLYAVLGAEGIQDLHDKHDAAGVPRAALHLSHFATCPNARSHRKGK